MLIFYYPSFSRKIGSRRLPAHIVTCQYDHHKDYRSNFSGEKKEMHRARSLLNAASVISLVSGGVSLSSSPAKADDTNATAHIETVVVTAERREVDLQKTTLAATVLTAKDL